jgi:preprotein translocase subunit SecF
MKMQWYLLFLMALVAGCAAPDPLPAKSAVVPVGLDLSGQWQLRSESTDSNREIQDVRQEFSGEQESLIPKSTKKRSKRNSDDVQVHVFLEAGASIKLTQTEHGLFVSFDRAIVEEYRFGEQRMVNVGAIFAERVSGWENGAYVIVTRGKEGGMLVESYRLADADTMVRTVRINTKDETRLDIEQTFDRR